MSTAMTKDEAFVEAHVQKHVKRAEAGQLEKVEMTLVNKAVHSAGGELAVFEMVARGMTKKRMLELLGISSGAFDKWLEKSAERASTYSRAREAGADALADETLSIADEAEPQTAQVAKLRIEARKWLAGKMNPAVYGEKAGATVNLNLGDMALESLRKRPTSVVIDV